MNTKCQLFARQPIFDVGVNVIAYELLWRSTRNDASDLLDGDQASSQVLLRAFTETDINEVVGEGKAFINFTRRLLIAPLLSLRKKSLLKSLKMWKLIPRFWRRYRS